MARGKRKGEECGRQTINLGGDRCLIHLEKEDYETFANFIKEEEHNQQERNYLAQHVC